MFRVCFEGIRSGIGWMHSKRADVSKLAHCAQACRSAPHREHIESKRMSSRSRRFSPHDLHANTTALSTSTPRPRGAPSERPEASGRGPRGRRSSEDESMYPRWRYLRSFIWVREPSNRASPILFDFHEEGIRIDRFAGPPLPLRTELKDREMEVRRAGRSVAGRAHVADGVAAAEVSPLGEAFGVVVEMRVVERVRSVPIELIHGQPALLAGKQLLDLPLVH